MSIQANTESQFVNLMNSMREHYKSGASHQYALPINLVHQDTEDNSRLFAYSSDADTDGSAALKTAVDGYKTSLNTMVHSSQASATQITDTLKNSNGDSAATKAFVKAMEAEKSKQKKKADAAIDKNFNALIKVGIKHPKQQHKILSLSSKIGAFFTNLLVKVGEFFKKLGASIVDFFKSVGQWFENAGKSIANWTDGAAHDVGHFFSTIF